MGLLDLGPQSGPGEPETSAKLPGMAFFWGDYFWLSGEGGSGKGPNPLQGSAWQESGLLPRPSPAAPIPGLSFANKGLCLPCSVLRP